MSAPEAAPPWGMHFPGAALRGAVFSALGMVAARLFFPGDAPVIAVVLVALGQADYVEALLDRNKTEVYGGVMTPNRANLRLARELFGLFAGVFLAYSVAVALVARPAVVFGDFLAGFQGIRLRDVEFGTYDELMRRNGAVLLAGFLLSTVYRHGGILLVLAWNAARWGVVLGCISQLEARAGGAGAALGMLVVLPHLIFEALAYVLAAMSGAFLGRGAMRHKVGSETFNRVGVAVLMLLILSVATLMVASFFESRLDDLVGIGKGGGG